MKRYMGYVDIICGEYGFLGTHILVCDNIDEAEKRMKKYVDEENKMYPGETCYKLNGVKELTCIDGYKIDYKFGEIP